MTQAARRPAGRLLAAGLLFTGVVGGLLSGCSSAVAVTPPSHAPAACDGADSHWPRTVSGHAAREVSPLSADARAWGDPPIIATCGWPPSGPTTDQCISVDGVDWVAHPLTDGVRFRTFGRNPELEVLVPHAYAPEPLLLPAFAAAARALPATGHHCS